jgi:thiamine monophosphate kinase
MDSGEGVIPALDQLMRLNGVGLNLTAQSENMHRRSALRVVHTAGIPGWLLPAVPHGELELLFTVPGDIRHLFLMAAAQSATETD